MKRILALFLMAILILTGCINTNEIDNEIDFTGFKLSYLTDTSKYTKKYSISIDYTEEYPAVELLDVESGTVTEMFINDRVNLDAYIDKLINDPELFRFDYKLGDTDSSIWYIQIDTLKRSYCNGGMKAYPEFWDEFWEVLIDTTEAESKQDFGFTKIIDELSVNQKEYTERTESCWMHLDYPEFVGDETYANVNDVILNAILDLPVFDMNNYSDLGVVNFYGEYTIMNMSNGIVSIQYQTSANVKGAAHPAEGCFGININLETGELIKLEEMISYEELISKVQSQEYSVEFGTLSTMTSEQVRKEIDDVINETEYDTYTYNFYDGISCIYLIVDGIVGSDYGIMKIMK